MMMDRRQVVEIRATHIRVEIVVQRIKIQNVVPKQMVMLRSTSVTLRISSSLHVWHLNVSGDPGNAVIRQIICNIVHVCVVQVVRVVAAQVIVQVD